MSAGCVLLSVTLDSVPGTLNIASHDRKLREALQIYRTGPGHSSLTLDQVKASRPLKTCVSNFSPSWGERVWGRVKDSHLILQNCSQEVVVVLLVLSLLPGNLITRNKIF